MTSENNNCFLSSKKISLITLVFSILIFCVLVITKHHYARLTADSMLYFSIAQKYISGDYANAVNGYWGPLLAWLLIPFLYVGASDVFTINALNLIIGICTIVGVWRLSFRFEINELIRAIVMIAFIPIVLKFSLVQPMDFLLGCILIFYVATIFDAEYPKKVHSGVFSGILGSLAYFTKAYAFPFFIVHFFIMNILHYFRNTIREDRMKVVRNAIAGYVLFSLISGTWIMIISDKYGHVTFSTMRDTNFNAPGPEALSGGLEFGVPVFSEGFFAPPNETAFVVWEDPSYLRGQPWNPWDSAAHFKHFMRLTLKNLSDGLRTLEAFSTLSIAIIISCILLLATLPLKSSLYQGTLLYALFTIILFSGGYILFHFEERYLWLTNVLLLLLGGYVLNVLFQKNIFSNPLLKTILIISFLASFIFNPTKYVIQVGRGGMDTEMHYAGMDLRNYGIEGNIASNREYVPVHDAWHKTFRLAYWLKSRYYGQARAGINDHDLQNELARYNIDYYFFWGEQSRLPEFLHQHNELTGGEIPGLKVFSLIPGNESTER